MQIEALVQEGLMSFCVEFLIEERRGLVEEGKDERL